MARNAAWDYPVGMLLLNLDRERALIFPSHTFYEPQGISLTYGLKWLQETRGSFGMTLKAKDDKAECELFNVLYDDEPQDADLESRCEQLLEIVRSWEC